MLGFSIDEPDAPPYVRTSASLLRLIAALAVLGSAWLVVRGGSDVDFSTALAAFLAASPQWLVTSVVGLCQFGFVVPVVLAFVTLLLRRRWTRIGRLLLTAAAAWALLVVVARLLPAGVLPLVHPGSGDVTRRLMTSASGYGIGGAFPGTFDLTVIAAAMAIDRPHWRSQWRWTSAVVVLAGVIAHFGVNLAGPGAVVLALAIAVLAAQIVQLVFGSPNLTAGAAAVGRTLAQLGYEVQAVSAERSFGSSAGFRVDLADGSRLFAKVLSRESWTALLPRRAYRAARFRALDPARPFRSLRAEVEHEALCALQAHAAGIPTPRVAAVTEVPPVSMLLAFEGHGFRTLRELRPVEVPPGAVTAVWSIVDGLQRSHILHRRLDADAFLVDEAGNLAVAEFGAATLAVTGPELATDVAEVLAATGAILGVDEAVTAAIDVAGPDAVAATLPLLQPLALTPATRELVSGTDVLERLGECVRDRTGAIPGSPAELERVKPRTVIGVAVAALAMWALIPQIVGASSLWGELRHADWRWGAVALVISAATYVGAGIALDGSVPQRIAFGPNLALQGATSFVGLATPVGPFALSVRFLQRRGIDTTTAVTGLGVNAIGGAVVHLALIAIFVALSGTSGLADFALPGADVAAPVAIAVAGASIVAVAAPWTRRQLQARVWPLARRSVIAVGEVARRPDKLASLFAGSFIVTMGYVLTLLVAAHAFDQGPSFTSVALVYLVGTAVASAAPTPGNLGALEAAFIAGLTSAGMTSAAAVGAVIVYRLATFWIPVLPGWLAFVYLQRTDNV